MQPKKIEGDPVDSINVFINLHHLVLSQLNSYVLSFYQGNHMRVYHFKDSVDTKLDKQWP